MNFFLRFFVLQSILDWLPEREDMKKKKEMIDERKISKQPNSHPAPAPGPSSLEIVNYIEQVRDRAWFVLLYGEIIPEL